MLQLPGGTDDDPQRQQKFEAIAAAMAGFGGKSVEIRYGTATLTFAASTDSANTVVTHGLGRTPVSIVATSLQGPAFGKLPTPNINTVGATTFGVNGELKVAHTGTITVSWIAIG